jgi:hypothetical protein
VLSIALVAVGCGSDGTGPPPPPPPPTPPPPPPPATQISLAPGEAMVLSDPAEFRAFELEGGTEPRDYVIVPHSVSQVAGSETSMRIRVTGPDVASGASASVLQAPAQVRPFRPKTLAERALLGESKLKGHIRRELEDAAARPARPSVREAGRRVSFGVRGSAGVPQVGERLTFRSSVAPNLSIDCTSTTTITGDVRKVGDNFALVEDAQVAGRFSTADWEELNQQLDNFVFPILEAYFGSPEDIDANERVYVLFTAEVNKLSDEGSGTFIAGFFNSNDLRDTAGCQASNEGEVLYLLAPDPTGEFGLTFSTQFAIRNARSIVAHEFQHLIHNEVRVFATEPSPEPIPDIELGVFSRLDDTWIDEGKSHIAEELAGLFARGFPVRANHDLDAVFQNQEDGNAFNAFHLANFTRMGRHMQNPESTRALGDVTGGDPGGDASLEMRGFALLFLRWLADQYAPAGPPGPVPGSGEAALFRQLASGGPLFRTGPLNVEQAVQAVAGVTRSWDQLLGEYMAVPAVDDNGPGGVDPSTQITTWDLRGMFLDLNQSNLGTQDPFTEPYPLDVQEIALTSTTSIQVPFDVRASAGKYFVLSSSGAAPDALVEITTQAGDQLPASSAAQVTIVRIR